MILLLLAFINSDDASRDHAEWCDDSGRSQDHTHRLPVMQVEGLRSDISCSFFRGGSAQWLREGQGEET